MTSIHMAKLNMKWSNKMELLKDCPLQGDASYTNIVFSEDNLNKKKQGFIYRVSKYKTKLVLLRYDIEDDNWERIGETKLPRNQCLTLMPMFKGRFIAALGDLKPLIFDTVLKEWITCELHPGSHPLVPREYGGAFQMPYGHHRDRSAKIK